MEFRKKFRIDRKLLPFKAHYFIFFGALSGASPFLPLIAKHLGIHAAAIGIIYSILPFCSFIAKPFFGFLVDYFRNIKLFLIILISIVSGTLISVIYLPSIENETNDLIKLQFEYLNNESYVTILDIPYSSCSDLSLKAEISCRLDLKNISYSTQKYFPCVEKVKWRCYTAVNNSFLELPRDFKILYHDNKGVIDILDSENSNDFKATCDVFRTNYTLNCSYYNTSSILDDSMPPSIYERYQFWVLALLIIVSGAASSSCQSLADVACCEALGERKKNYGRQRLWGTISWGLICPLSGVLNDAFSGEEKSFSPGFYLMFFLFVTDLFLLLNIHLSKQKMSSNMCKDVCKVLSSLEIAIFAFGVFIIGALSSIIQTYEFWFLEDMGASQSLLGLAIAMQCLVGEVPLLFFSGWFIQKFGYFFCVAFSFSGFALRLVLYSCLTNPWLVLPIDILHGFTFAVFFATLTSFASVKAPVGLEATTLGFLGGLYEGLGPAAGNFLGGFGLENLGSRYTFLFCGALSLICVPIFFIAPTILRKFTIEKDQIISNEKMLSMESNNENNADGENILENAAAQ